MKLTPFLMFTGRAEEAMLFYAALFPGSRVLSVDRYGSEGPGPAGSVRLARFELNGRELMCIDSPVQHAFGFTPSLSIHVDCDDPLQISATFDALAEDGQVLMPLGKHPFSDCYGWVQDRFGVSWQLNLATAEAG